MYKEYDGVYINEMQHYHPDGILANKLFEERLDTTDEWIFNNVGIKERRYLSDYRGNTPVLEMCKRVLEKRTFELSDIDCLITASTFADKFYPTTAQSLCQEYSLDIANYQILGGCTALLQAINLAANFIQNNVYKKVLILNGEPMTRQVDYGDRSSCILFGDASNLVLMSNDSKGAKVSAIDYSGVGMDLVGNYNFSSSTNTTLYEFVSGKKERRQKVLEFNNVMSAIGKFYQDGRGIKQFVYDQVPPVIEGFLDKTRVKKDDLAHYVFHQANFKIMSDLIERTKLPTDKHRFNIENFGNTASAGWGSVLSELFQDGRALEGLTLICSFGAGMTYGNILLGK